MKLNTGIRMWNSSTERMIAGGGSGEESELSIMRHKKNLTDEIAFAITLWDLCQYEDFPIRPGENTVQGTPEPEEY